MAAFDVDGDASLTRTKAILISMRAVVMLLVVFGHESFDALQLNAL